MTTSSVKKVRIRIGDAHSEITLHPPKPGFNVFGPLISTLPHDREIQLGNGATIKLKPRKGIVETVQHGRREIDATEISAQFGNGNVVLVSNGREKAEKGVTHKLVRVTHGNERVIVKPLETHPRHEDIVRSRGVEVPYSLMKKHIRGCMIHIGEEGIVVSGESADYGPTVKAEVAKTLEGVFGELEIAVKVVYDASQGKFGHEIEKMRADE